MRLDWLRRVLNRRRGGSAVQQVINAGGTDTEPAQADLRPLLYLVTWPLASSDLNIQIRARHEALCGDGHDRLAALGQALTDSPWDRVPEFVPTPDWHLDPAHSRYWLCLHVDWKGDDEVQWQVQAIARTLGLPGHFECDTPGPWARTQEVLEEAADWMRERGHELVFVQTGGDEFMALPLALARADEAQAEAARLGVVTFLM